MALLLSLSSLSSFERSIVEGGEVVSRTRAQPRPGAAHRSAAPDRRAAGAPVFLEEALTRLRLRRGVIDAPYGATRTRGRYAPAASTGARPRGARATSVMTAETISKSDLGHPLAPSGRARDVRTREATRRESEKCTAVDRASAKPAQAVQPTP